MCMDARDQRRWRVCLILAVCCAVYAVTATAAVAVPIDTDVTLVRSYLPQGHPCRDGIAVTWVPGLRNGEAGAAAPYGRLINGRWLEQDVEGGWRPLECYIELEPATWAEASRCEQRRIMFHEAGHLAGLDHDAGGIMSQDWMVRDRVAVPGCPAQSQRLRDRIVDRVLGMAPVGFEVSCGPRRRMVVACRADHGRRVLRYRARLSDRLGSRFTVVRVKGRTR